MVDYESKEISLTTAETEIEGTIEQTPRACKHLLVIRDIEFATVKGLKGLTKMNDMMAKMLERAVEWICLHLCNERTL